MIINNTLPNPHDLGSNDEILVAGLWELLRRNKSFISKYKEQGELYKKEHQEYIHAMTDEERKLYEEAKQINQSHGPEAYNAWRKKLNEYKYLQHSQSIDNEIPNIQMGKYRNFKESIFAGNPISSIICESIRITLPEEKISNYPFVSSFYDQNFFKKSFNQLDKITQNSIFRNLRSNFFAMELCHVEETKNFEALSL